MSCSNEQLKFTVYIINQLAQAFDKPNAVIFNFLLETGILDNYIISCYDSLHTLGREYLIDDISGLLHKEGVVL